MRAFYCEALAKAQKYFRDPLTSKVLRACDIFDPNAFFSTDCLRQLLIDLTMSSVSQRRCNKLYSSEILCQVIVLEGWALQTSWSSQLCLAGGSQQWVYG